MNQTGCKAWLSSKNRIAEKHDVQVNFSDKHNFYLSAYRYVAKGDQEVPHSENHPPVLLTAAFLKTKNSIAGFRATCAKKVSPHKVNFLVLLQRSEKV